MLIFLFFITLSYQNKYEETIKNGYLGQLKTACVQSETNIQNVKSNVNILANMEELVPMKTFPRIITGSSALKASSILSQIQKANPLIDNIYIYNRKASAVYSNDGTFHATTFFTTHYRYVQYSKLIWDELFVDDNGEKTLYPTIVNSSNKQKNIIPMAFSYKGDNYDYLIVANIDLSSVNETVSSSKITSSGNFLILNRENGNIFGDTGEFSATVGSELYSVIGDRLTCSFDYEFDGVNSLVMAYTPKGEQFAYSYLAIIPYSDIKKSFFRIMFTLALLGFAVIIFVLFAIYIGAKRIYSPIESLTSMFGGRDSTAENQNAITQLNKYIEETLKTNSSLDDKYKQILPLAKERYIINYINSNDRYDCDDDSTDIPVDFKHDYFCSIVIKLQPTESFYNLYNSAEYNAIKTGLHDIVKTEFSEKYNTYIIPSEVDTLYLLLNIDSPDCKDDINDIINKFYGIMNYDKQYITIKIGVGNIYKNLSGLKKSHQEAIKSITGIVGISHIKINNDSGGKFKRYIMTINDEDLLYNQLILCQQEKAEETINSIVKKNVEQNVDDSEIVQLYVQILNIVFKVMQIKKIDYDTENQGAFQIISEIIKNPISEIHNITLGYIKTLDNANAKTVRIDIESIVEYIKENSNTDIGLDMVADEFNTTPKYISRLIKEKLGVNFTDYISGLKIANAKSLLATTDKTINEICTECGFNSNSTFIRNFKKVVGITPTEYRKIKKKI